MHRYENQCCDCAVPAYPCMGNSCPLRRVLVTECDKCGNSEDTLYHWNGGEYCLDCIIQDLDLQEVEYVYGS